MDIYSPIKSTDYSSFPELWSSHHVQNTIGSPVLVAISNLFLFEFLYCVFQLSGFNGNAISLGIFHEQLVSLVETIFSNQPSRRLRYQPSNKIYTCFEEESEHILLKLKLKSSVEFQQR